MSAESIIISTLPFVTLLSTETISFFFPVFIKSEKLFFTLFSNTDPVSKTKPRSIKIRINFDLKRNFLSIKKKKSAKRRNIEAVLLPEKKIPARDRITEKR